MVGCRYTLLNKGTGFLVWFFRYSGGLGHFPGDFPGNDLGNIWLYHETR
jgi:hypothetical protein